MTPPRKYIKPKDGSEGKSGLQIGRAIFATHGKEYFLHITTTMLSEEGFP